MSSSGRHHHGRWRTPDCQDVGSLASPIALPMWPSDRGPTQVSWQRRQRKSGNTDPEAVEVGVGGIVGLVVSFHQGGNNFGLLLVQTWPHGLAGRLLFLPLHYHVLLPLDLLICQDDCRVKRRGGKIIRFLFILSTKITNQKQVPSSSGEKTSRINGLHCCHR